MPGTLDNPHDWRFYMQVKRSDLDGDIFECKRCGILSLVFPDANPPAGECPVPKGPVERLVNWIRG